MKTFEPKDRVKVRRGGRADFKGTVCAVNGESSINVIEDGIYGVHKDSPFHSSQLVLLKKKVNLPEKKKAHRIWIENRGKQGGTVSSTNGKLDNLVNFHWHKNKDGYDEYREVLPGDIVTTEEELKKAWDYLGHLNILPKRCDSVVFDDFCKALKGEK